jgi:uncharacterized protein (TIGR00255 family)
MIKSMTGFGKATGRHNNRQLTAEIKSVNSKGLDFSLKLPSRFRDKEQELKTELARYIERGKVDLYLQFENVETSKTVSVNRELAKAYYGELKSLDAELGLNTGDLLPLVLKMPDVLTSESVSEVDEDEWKEIISLCRQAAESFNEFRIAEGKNLRKDLEMRIGIIEQHLLEIEKLEPRRTLSIRERLSKSISELAGSVEADQNRLEQELVYYIEKLDITEEKVRLRSHCEYFVNTMEEETSNGRKLGFIAQEVGREINTIGSKANDAGIQRYVVQMKDELEKIKEQVLNVL